jgi:hypothetical protein
MKMPVITPTTNSPFTRFGINAGAFLFFGIFMTYGLSFLLTVNGPFSGLDIGASRFEEPPIAALVLPISAYFLCGLIAALSPERRFRIAAAVIAHSALLFTCAFSRAHDVSAFVVIALATVLTFGFAWFQMLRQESHAERGAAGNCRGPCSLYGF